MITGHEKVPFIGVTGGLGSGKTTVCGFLSQWGAATIDADAIGKNLVDTDKSVQKALIAAFGPSMSAVEGQIEKNRLAEAAFASREAVESLNNIVHPSLQREIKRQFTLLSKKHSLVILDAALIFESGLGGRLDKIILVLADTETRLARATSNGALTREEALRRIKWQLSDEKKTARADMIIPNNGSLGELEDNVRRVYEKLVPVNDLKSS